MELNFKPFPVLETERLVLRNMHESDNELLFKMRSDDEVMKFIPRPRPTLLEDVHPVMQMIQEKYENEEALNWFIELKETLEPIGTIGFYRIQKENYRTEVGYMMLPIFHRKGIMHEALSKVIEYGFQILNFNSIFAVIDPENHSSRKLLLKNHFLVEGHFKEDFCFEDRFYDSEYLSILKKDYKNER